MAMVMKSKHSGPVCHRIKNTLSSSSWNEKNHVMLFLTKSNSHFQTISADKYNDKPWKLI